MVGAANMSRAAPVFESRDLMSASSRGRRAASLELMRYRYRRLPAGTSGAVRRRITISGDAAGSPSKLESLQREREAKPKRRWER
jgi:hypothetical protein